MKLPIVAELLLLLGANLNLASVSCFVLAPQHTNNPTPLLSLFSQSSATSFTIDQLTTDPFRKQLGYAAEICARLAEHEEGNDDVTQLLQAQLSHSDGIRGFFVQYLTTGEDSKEFLPRPLQTALTKLCTDLEEDNDLISLTCMNVVMPTAMSTMHTDPDLQASSRSTAQKGIQVLQFLRSCRRKEVTTTAKAMVEAASRPKEEDSKDADPDVDYWKRFFDRYDYGPRERSNIASSISEAILS